MRLHLTPLVALSLPTLALAQVGYGTDESGDQDNFFLDVSTGTSTGPIWTGAEVWGLADDEAAGIYYVNDGSDIYTQSIGAAGTPATLLGTMTFMGAANNKTALAFGNGVIYAHRNISTEALYSVDVVTLDSTIVYNYTDTAIDIGGLDFDPATGLLLGTNDASGYTDPVGTAGRGVIVFDIPGATEVNTYPYPTGVTDIDGLAFDPSGVIWYIEDNPAPLHNYDIATMTFDPMPPMNAIVGTEIFSGGTFIDSGSGGLGSNYCMANPNSTGVAGAISATGSDVAADNNVTLLAADLPTNATAYFLASMVQAFIAAPAGSAGNLCVGGQIGRYVGPGQIQDTGGSGSISLALDLTQTPSPTGFLSVQAGETWNFQCWHRDSDMGTATSNFTDGLEIPFN